MTALSRFFSVFLFREWPELNENESYFLSIQAHENHATHTSLPQSPMAPHRTNRTRPSKGGVDQDQYAKMLRATYQNMGRIQNKNQMQHSIDVKKFNNTELGRNCY